MATGSHTFTTTGATASTLVKSAAGANNNLTFTAVRLGTPGSDVRVRMVSAGAESVSVSGEDITVNFNDGVSTANSLKTTIDASTAATALVTVAVEGTGAGTWAASDASGYEALSGGAGYQLTMSTGNEYPVRPSQRKIQASEESAGGQMYVQDKGIEIWDHNLAWTMMPEADFADLNVLVRTHLVYKKNTFIWNDVDNVNHTVRLMNNPLEPAKPTGGYRSLTLLLREESPS